MAEVNPELAKLVVETLKYLGVSPSTAGTTGGNLGIGEDEEAIEKRIDAYGAAFKRLYGHIATATEKGAGESIVPTESGEIHLRK